MTAADLAAALDAIADRAAKLRDAGVRELSVENITVKLAEPPLPAPEQQPREQPQRPDVANDPATYGLPHGAQVPGIDWGDPVMLAKQAQRERDLAVGDKRKPRG